MKRDKIIEAIKELPKEIELEELIEKIIFVDKIEKGIKQLDKKNTISHEKVKEIAKKW